ncbi:hypothetical protein QMO56_25870 [Roseomonas sp. E05]|uniref:hypothetical protein n=1 Tax=Roseomonas sp. E05 TaxID=3046310 RepID=UPI0024B9DEB9|nr:hypothetical protein [Roseomonas sp. E05]MDJ0391535.1 hypothetical protein [Roseomonas sp. E05]
MRTYRVTGMTDEHVAERVRQKLKAHFGHFVTVETDVNSGEVRLDQSSDPQVVSFLIDSAGCSVDSVDG